MKRLLLLLLTVPAFGQQTVTSVANGLATNPFVWSCSCIPNTNANVTISHSITMNSNWVVNGGGSITVTSTGSFNQDANRSILIDGAGSTFTVQGTATFENFAFTNGSDGSNSGTFNVNNALYYGANTSFTNTGDLLGIDSLETEGTFVNTGFMDLGNFLNTGTFNHNDGSIIADSLGNTGNYMVTNGITYVNAFGNDGITSIASNGAPIFITYDGYNAGQMYLSQGTTVNAGANFYNGDLANPGAILQVDGLMTVNTDFASSDTLRGTGSLCVGQGTSNSGVVSGTLNFCDNTGSGGFDLNFGTIAPTVVYCSPGCYLGLSQNNPEKMTLAPNPASTNFAISGENIREAVIVSSTGEMLKKADSNFDHIDVSDLKPGIYFVVIRTDVETKSEKLVIE